MDVILIRQDPPFDMAYLTTTYILETLKGKVKIFNDPFHIRNNPEKWLILQYPHLTIPTLISRDSYALQAFRREHKNIVIKPLYGHGGYGVFHIREDDSNFLSFLEYNFMRSNEPLIVQPFLKEVSRDEKRIVIIDGQIMPVMNRVPPIGEVRANLRAGGVGEAESLTYAQAGPTMMREYERQQAAILKRIRIALPDAALLVMGPLDAAERVDDGLRTRPAIPKLVEAQRRAALANGAAFWDTFAVMGGEGSMARWVKNRVGSSDLVHPSWGGAVFLGNELSRSMLSGFEAHQERLARTMPWTPPSQSAGIPASPKNLESSVPAPQAARMPARTVRPTRIQDPLYAGRARAARQSQP